MLPELVVHRPTGEAETVLYHEMPAMLLNELQKQQRHIEQQEVWIQKQEGQISASNGNPGTGGSAGGTWRDRFGRRGQRSGREVPAGLIGDSYANRMKRGWGGARRLLRSSGRGGT